MANFDQWRHGRGSSKEGQESEEACVAYMRSCSYAFYPGRLGILGELQPLTTELGGQLEALRFTWKLAWMELFFGRRATQRTLIAFQNKRASLIRTWDKAMYEWENRKAPSGQANYDQAAR